MSTREADLVFILRRSNKPFVSHQWLARYVIHWHGPGYPMPRVKDLA